MKGEEKGKTALKEIIYSCRHFNPGIWGSKKGEVDSYGVPPPLYIENSSTTAVLAQIMGHPAAGKDQAPVKQQGFREQYSLLGGQKRT